MMVTTEPSKVGIQLVIKNAQQQQWKSIFCAVVMVAFLVMTLMVFLRAQNDVMTHQQYRLLFYNRRHYLDGALL